MGGRVELLLAGWVTEALLTPAATSILWGLHHPYWLVAIAITLIILVQLSLSLVSQLFRLTLIWIGKFPLSLGRWLLTKTPLTPSNKALEEQKLTVLLAKLESLQQEQTSLLIQIQSALKARDIHPNE
ncbi:hypothetical protein [Leptothoe sp. PORK10 BA2]|uniref:hypothetical protein n=1 Tax=Leptothoe sp. PORK10 BA2 TaxID=3110254 RepID=UPI002B204E5F|nr:hypothetical protein [Leptothoe sp. PORK10 BA2]MEA5462635.1 hypothetical protein [Leptothoe sp. PORK10 BA2]